MRSIKVKLVKGIDLNPRQITQVKAAFVHRFTGEHRPQWANKPMPNGEEYKPTHETDLEWIIDHAFYLNKDGTLRSNPGYCEPVYMADYQEKTS